jgi:hypothetical protein
MMRSPWVAAAIAILAAGSPAAGGAAAARSRHDAVAVRDGGRPVIRFPEDAGERSAQAASAPHFTRFVHPAWARSRPRGWHGRWPQRRPEELPFSVLGWFLSALSR